MGQTAPTIYSYSGGGGKGKTFFYFLNTFSSLILFPLNVSGGCKCKSTSRLSTRQHTQNWGAAHFELLREKMINPEKIKNRKMMDERLGLIYILKNKNKISNSYRRFIYFFRLVIPVTIGKAKK
jgi:hypothetical protein